MVVNNDSMVFPQNIMEDFYNLYTATLCKETANCKRKEDLKTNSTSYLNLEITEAQNGGLYDDKKVNLSWEKNEFYHLGKNKEIIFDFENYYDDTTKMTNVSSIIS
jgi:hypothetical protein